MNSTFEFTILNWNIGGAKFLEEKEERREQSRATINRELKDLIETHNYPCVVTLQEIVQFGESSKNAEDIIIPPEGYRYFPFPLIDSDSLSSQEKWNKVREKGGWPPDTFFAQGNAMLINNIHPSEKLENLPKEIQFSDSLKDKILYDDKERLLIFKGIMSKEEKVQLLNLSQCDHYKKVINALFRKSHNNNEAFSHHYPVKNLTKSHKRRPHDTERHFIEQVPLRTCLYFGERGTEPRAALVAHFIYNPKNEDDKPLDIFVVNLHLTTLMMEREGITNIDLEATKIRLSQIDAVFRDIVSQYNQWKRQEFPERGKPRKNWKTEETGERYEPVWVLAGDFNFTPESVEYETIEKMNFIDVVPIKGSGTKAKGTGAPATLTLDYIFAGPKYISLDPIITGAGIGNNEVYHYTTSSDHYPMYAKIPISIPEQEEE